MTELKRRDLLKLSLLGGAGLLVSPAAAYAGQPTPAQPEGPFHPLRRGLDAAGDPVVIDQRIREYLDTDSDLTFVSDEPGTARGLLAYMSGRVLDEDGAPLEDALVEIWQACASGRYNHRADPNDAWLDPNFQYWGRTQTDAEGRFLFRTIVPGAYRASASWIRPPHIHAKLSLRGYRELTTQVYFEGVPFWFRDRWWSEQHLGRLNQVDAILDGVPPALRPQVVAAARAPLADEPLEDEARVFHYELTLASIAPAPNSGGGNGDPLLDAMFD